MKNNTKYWRNTVAIVGIVLGLIVPATMAFAQAHGNPQVVPLELNAFGNTYGEWSARWWQWALSIPKATNPILDTTGAHCAEGQGGQVWFLAGTFGGAATRSCTVPSGKALFFPFLNTAFGQGAGCTDLSDCDVTALRVLAAARMDDPMTLEVSIDGRRVKDPSQFRATSPVFNYFLPAGNVLGNPLGGTHGPLVSDGYWLFLEPLSSGAHTIHFKGVRHSGFETEVTYNLTVME